jgi:hypothetical protein
VFNKIKQKSFKNQSPRIVAELASFERMNDNGDTIGRTKFNPVYLIYPLNTITYKI